MQQIEEKSVNSALLGERLLARQSDSKLEKLDKGKKVERSTPSRGETQHAI